MTWSWCSNARDVGGFVTEAGICRVVDLRAEEEAAQRPSPLKGSSIYRLVPIVDPRMDRLRQPGAERDLLDTYRGSIDQSFGGVLAYLRAAGVSGQALSALAARLLASSTTAH